MDRIGQLNGVGGEHGQDGFGDEDETSEILEDDLLQYANMLGVDLDAEPQYEWLVMEGLRAPLPPNFRACEDDEGVPYYYDMTDGKSHWEYPLDRHYRDMMKAERGREAYDLQEEYRKLPPNEQRDMQPQLQQRLQFLRHQQLALSESQPADHAQQQQTQSRLSPQQNMLSPSLSPSMSPSPQQMSLSPQQQHILQQKLDKQQQLQQQQKLDKQHQLQQQQKLQAQTSKGKVSPLQGGKGKQLAPLKGKPAAAAAVTLSLPKSSLLPTSSLLAGKNATPSGPQGKGMKKKPEKPQSLLRSDSDESEEDMAKRFGLLDNSDLRMTESDESSILSSRGHSGTLLKAPMAVSPRPDRKRGIGGVSPTVKRSQTASGRQDSSPEGQPHRISPLSAQSGANVNTISPLPLLRTPSPRHLLKTPTTEELANVEYQTSNYDNTDQSEDESVMPGCTPAISDNILEEDEEEEDEERGGGADGEDDDEDDDDACDDDVISTGGQHLDDSPDITPARARPVTATGKRTAMSAHMVPVEYRQSGLTPGVAVPNGKLPTQRSGATPSSIVAAEAAADETKRYETELTNLLISHRQELDSVRARLAKELEDELDNIEHQHSVKCEKRCAELASELQHTEEELRGRQAVELQDLEVALKDEMDGEREALEQEREEKRLTLETEHEAEMSSFGTRRRIHLGAITERANSDMDKEKKRIEEESQAAISKLKADSEATLQAELGKLRVSLDEKSEQEKKKLREELEAIGASRVAEVKTEVEEARKKQSVSLEDIRNELSAELVRKREDIQQQHAKVLAGLEGENAKKIQDVKLAHETQLKAESTKTHTAELNTLRAALNKKLEEEKKKLREELQSVRTQELGSLETEVQQARQQLSKEDVRKEVEAQETLAGTRHQLLELIAKQEEKRDALKQEITGQEERRDALKQETGGLESKKRQLSNDLSEQEQRLAGPRREVTQLAAEIRRQKEASVADKEQHVVAVNLREAGLKDLDNQIANSKESLKNLQNQITQSKETLKNLQDEVAQSKETLNNLHDQTAQSKESLNSLQHQTAQCKETLKNLQDEIAQSRESPRSPRDEITLPRESASNPQDEVAQSEENLKILHDQTAQCQDTLKSLRDEIAQSREALKNLQYAQGVGSTPEQIDVRAMSRRLVDREERVAAREEHLLARERSGVPEMRHPAYPTDSGARQPAVQTAAVHASTVPVPTVLAPNMPSQSVPSSNVSTLSAGKSGSPGMTPSVSFESRSSGGSQTPRPSVPDQQPGGEEFERLRHGAGRAKHYIHRAEDELDRSRVDTESDGNSARRSGSSRRRRDDSRQRRSSPEPRDRRRQRRDRSYTDSGQSDYSHSRRSTSQRRSERDEAHGRRHDDDSREHSEERRHSRRSPSTGRHSHVVQARQVRVSGGGGRHSSSSVRLDLEEESDGSLSITAMQHTHRRRSQGRSSRPAWEENHTGHRRSSSVDTRTRALPPHLDPNSAVSIAREVGQPDHRPGHTDPAPTSSRHRSDSSSRRRHDDARHHRRSSSSTRSRILVLDTDTDSTLMDESEYLPLEIYTGSGRRRSDWHTGGQSDVIAAAQSSLNAHFNVVTERFDRLDGSIDQLNRHVNRLTPFSSTSSAPVSSMNVSSTVMPSSTIHTVAGGAHSARRTPGIDRIGRNPSGSRRQQGRIWEPSNDSRLSDARRTEELAAALQRTGADKTVRAAVNGLARNRTRQYPPPGGAVHPAHTPLPADRLDRSRHLLHSAASSDTMATGPGVVSVGRNGHGNTYMTSRPDLETSITPMPLRTRTVTLPDGVQYEALEIAD